MLFWIIGGVILLYSLITGWRRGVVRQTFSVFAVVGAYFSGIFGGKLLLPFLHGLGYPDVVLSIVAGCLMGLLVYLGVSALSAILFKNTGQQEVFIVRWGYGIGGALVGGAFGIFLLWVTLIALRLLGTIAETEIKYAKNPVEPTRPSLSRTGARPGNPAVHPGVKPAGEPQPQPASQFAPDARPLVKAIAEMKRAVDQSPVGSLAQKMDPLPNQIYGIMANLTRVISNQDAVDEFLDYPGVQKLSNHPRIRSLLNDPEISKAARNREYLQLLRNPKVVEVLNDPAVLQLVRQIDLEKGLEFALRKEALAGPTPRFPTRR